MLTTIEKVNILQRTPVFQGVRTESLARVAAIAREVSCDARQLLFRENEGADTMFVILEGRVALVRNGQQAQELAAGQVVGALALLAGDSHRESAMATQPVRALQIDQRSEEHTSELQSRLHLVCRLLLEKKKKRSRNVT